MNKTQIEELRKLKTLLNEGIITKDEFTEARNNLLLSSESEDGAHVIEDAHDNVEAATPDIEPISAEIKQAGNDQKEIASEPKADKKSAFKNPFFLIIVGVVSVIVIVIGLMQWQGISETKKMREALPGEWVYDVSYKGESNDGYDAGLKSVLRFSEDGNVEIIINDCVCTGKWKPTFDGQFTYIKITDYDVQGSSEYIESIIDNLNYYSGDGSLYWYIWDGENITDWHYYKHK